MKTGSKKVLKEEFPVPSFKYNEVGFKFLRPAP